MKIPECALRGIKLDTIPTCEIRTVKHPIPRLALIAIN